MALSGGDGMGIGFEDPEMRKRSLCLGSGASRSLRGLGPAWTLATSEDSHWGAEGD